MIQFENRKNDFLSLQFVVDWMTIEDLYEVVEIEDVRRVHA